MPPNTNGKTTGFIAYPGVPKEIGDTLERAVGHIDQYASASHHYETWAAFDEAGVFIRGDVLGSIDKNDIFVADITVLNFNVTYEIGYAIGKKKPITLLRRPGVAETDKKIQQIGIFDTIRYNNYENHLDVVKILTNMNTPRNIGFPAAVNVNSPVYILDTLQKTDQSQRIIARIKKSKLRFRNFDPLETPRMASTEIDEIAKSVGVIVSLIPTRYQDAEIHNIRAAFIAGLAEGMGKIVKILQFENDPVPIDYRDFVTTCFDLTQIDEEISLFVPQVTEQIQNASTNNITDKRGLLAKIDLGASAAENEMQELYEYYLETDAFNQAYRGEVRLVLGRKGSGKTALFTRVRDKIRGNKKNIVVDLKPETYKLLKFKDYVLEFLEDGTLEHTIMAFWEYVLLLEICYKILEKDQHIYKRDHEIFDNYVRLSELYKADAYVSEGDFSERMSKLLQAITNDFKAKYPEKAHFKLSDAEVTELLHKHEIAKLRKELEEYLQLKDGVLLLIDNIDKGWNTGGVQTTDLIIVRTLLDATRKIENQLSKKGISCKSLIFLRNDVYENLIEYMTDRGKDAKIRLDWTDHQALQEMLRLRFIHKCIFPQGASFEEIWRQIAVSHIDGEESFHYILERCLMRPRALIDCVKRCLGFALNRGHTKIEEEDILAGTQSYSTDLLREIGLEMRDILPESEDKLYMFIGCNQIMQHDDLLTIFLENNVPDDKWNDLMTLLLWFGVLGLYRQDDDIKYIYSTPINYDMKLLKGMIMRVKEQERHYVINPAFCASLENVAA